MNKNLVILFLIFLSASCVPNKDIIYLQGKPLAKGEIERVNSIPYKLQVHDIIFIDIKSIEDNLLGLFKKSSSNSSVSGGSVNENLSGGGAYLNGYSVDNYGNVRLPYLGNINVLGYTTKEVREKIEKELWKFIKNKEDVFVSVKLAGIKYTIIGEIVNPGPKIIYQNQVSIIDAIANAGDITLVGNRKKVEVYRRSISGVKKFTIDLTKVEAFDSEIFYIKSNDIINVIPLKQKSWGTGTTGLQTLTTVISIFSLVASTIILARNL